MNSGPRSVTSAAGHFRTPSPPRVTLILLAFRQQDYVQQAIASALAQDHHDLEIILSDDCSPDGTLEVMQRAADRYRGPHMVRTNRTQANRGIVGHFNEVVALARGEVVVYLAGDDIAAPDRVSRLAAALAADPSLSFAESRYIPFTDDMNPENLLRSVAYQASPTGCRTFGLDDLLARRMPLLSSSTRAFRKDALLRFPPLDTRLPSEDSASALRLLFRGRGALLEAPLLLKRVHTANLTGPAATRSMNFDLIGTQYATDIAHALARRDIDPRTAKRLSAWAERTIERRKLRLLFESRKPSLVELATRILPSSALTLRDKAQACRNFASNL